MRIAIDVKKYEIMQLVAHCIYFKFIVFLKVNVLYIFGKCIIGTGSWNVDTITLFVE